MARYSTSLDVGKEMESEPVKPMNPPDETEEQVTLDDVSEADEPEEEEFLEQKRAKKPSKKSLTQKPIMDEIPNEDFDESDEQKSSVNYAKQFMEMDAGEEDDAETEVKSVDEPAAYEEVSSAEEIIQVPEEQDVADIIRGQKPPHKRIQKSEPKKQINKTIQKQQTASAQNQTSSQEKTSTVQPEEKSGPKVREGISWGWIAVLIIIIVIAGMAWKYWPQAPVVMPQPVSIPQNNLLQNNTEANKSLVEPDNADDVLAGLSDQLRG